MAPIAKNFKVKHGLDVAGTTTATLFSGSGASLTSIPQSAITNLSTDLGGKIATSLVDAKGDLLVGTADNTVGRLAAGTNGYALVADSSQSSGLKWEPQTKVYWDSSTPSSGDGNVGDLWIVV